MNASFDPYAEWLGIQSKQRPPNYYRLLGLALFETDPAAISHGAAKRLQQLGVHLSGENAELVKRLFGEIEIARQCLLEPMMKAVYDAELHKRLSPGDDALSGLPLDPTAPIGSTDSRYFEPPLPPRGSAAPPAPPNRLRILSTPVPPPISRAAANDSILPEPPPVVWYKRYGLISIMIVTAVFLCGVIVASNWLARTLMQTQNEPVAVEGAPQPKPNGEADAKNPSELPVQPAEPIPPSPVPKELEEAVSPVESDPTFPLPAETISPPDGAVIVPPAEPGTLPPSEIASAPSPGGWIRLVDSVSAAPLTSVEPERLSPAVGSALETLRKAMAQRNLPEARLRLEQAQREIAVEGDRQAVARTAMLLNAWNRFWRAVAESAAALRPGDRLVLGDRIIQVSETFDDRIVVQSEGRTAELPIRIGRMDRRLAVALAGRGLEGSGPAGFVPLAAFEMADAQGDRIRAAAFLELARARGVWVDPLWEQLGRQGRPDNKSDSP